MICEGCDREVDKLVEHHWFDESGEEIWFGGGLCRTLT